jgi:hypothetical protein
MIVSENNTEKVLASLEAIFKEYDTTFASFVSLSSTNVINSKNKILKHVRTVITDSLSDVMLLKKTVGKDSAQYVKILNDIYKRVYDGVMLVYNHEFNSLNNLAHKEKVILATNLAPYVSLLSESSKNISSIDCEIKQRLNHSSYFHDLKAQIKNRSIGGVFRDFVFGDNKITLRNFTKSIIVNNDLDNSDAVLEDQQDAIANTYYGASKAKESALDRYSNLK